MHLSGCWWWIACRRAGSTQGHCKANRKGNMLFFNNDFPNWAVRHHWIIDALISDLGDGAGDQEADLGQEVCPTERWGKRTPHMAEPCSPGCGMLRGCQKEIGTYIQIYVNVLLSPPKVLCSSQERKLERSFLVGKNFACVTVLGSCLWRHQGQHLQVPSPLDPIVGPDTWPWGRVFHKPLSRAFGSEGFSQKQWKHGVASTGPLEGLLVW